MVIRNDYNLIFVHIPRTAGRSLEVYLKKLPEGERAYCNKMLFFLNTKMRRARRRGLLGMHAKASYIKAAVGKHIWENYNKVAVVRNPWDIMVSSYCFTRERAEKLDYMKNVKLKEQVQEVAGMTFEEYIKSIWGREFILEIKTDMIDHINDENGEIIVDYVLKFENIERDFKDFCSKVGLPMTGDLPQVRDSRKDRDYRGYYNEQTKDLVAKRFAKIIDLYEYVF